MYFGIFAFFLGVPVYIWMKVQRGEYGESPVTPIDYPADSPYAVPAQRQRQRQRQRHGSTPSAPIAVDLTAETVAPGTN